MDSKQEWKLQFDVETFWYPLLVMGLLGYLMRAHYLFVKVTSAEYQRLYGEKPDRLRHALGVAIPKADGSTADQAFAAFYRVESSRIVLKWGLAPLFFAAVKAFG